MIFFFVHLSSQSGLSVVCLSTDEVTSSPIGAAAQKGEQGRIHGVISRVLLGRGSNITDSLQRWNSLFVLIRLVFVLAGPTDQPTDQPTVTYRVACTRLKRGRNRLIPQSSIPLYLHAVIRWTAFFALDARLYNGTQPAGLTREGSSWVMTKKNRSWIPFLTYFLLLGYDSELWFFL